MENVHAYLDNKKLMCPFTGELQNPDERLMRSVEKQIGVTEAGVHDFRNTCKNYFELLNETYHQLKFALERKIDKDTHTSLSFKQFAAKRDLKKGN
jgi:serine protein kinase